MNRRHFLVSYDIADDKRRAKIAKLLEGEGDRVQYSVFFCDCNPKELAKLRSKIIRIIHQGDDQVIIVDLGLEHHPLDEGLEVLGAPYKPYVRTIVV